MSKRNKGNTSLKDMKASLKILKKYKLKYWNLGRNKAKGEITLKGKTANTINNLILEEFSKHLISSDISINFDSEIGKVYAGVHEVGNFEIREI